MNNEDDNDHGEDLDDVGNNINNSDDYDENKTSKKA